MAITERRTSNGRRAGDNDRPIYLHGPIMRSIIGGYVILAIGVVLGLYFSWHSVNRADRAAACISSWANDTTSRSATLTQLSSERQHRLDLLMRDIALPSRSKAQRRRRFRRDLLAYNKAADRYMRGTVAHPVPKPPSVRC